MREDSERSGHTRCDEEYPENCKNGLDSINQHSLSVVVAGNFDKDIPTRKQIKALSELINELSKKYSIAPDKVIGHRDASGTACPGEHLLKFLPKYSQNYHARRS